jgi:putative acetyltransferase
MIRCQHLQWGPSGQPLTRSQMRTFYGVKQEYAIRNACEQLAYQPKSPLRPCGKSSRIYNGDNLLEAVSSPLISRTSQPMPSHPSFTLRDYHAQDLQALVELFSASVHQLAADDYEQTQRQVWAPAQADMPAWKARLAALELLIAENNRQLAGFIGFSVSGHIDLLFTAPQFARQGVATALYAAAQTRIQAAGATSAFTEASLTARPFFARQGFSVEQAQTVVRGTVTLQRFAMRKPLRPLNG